MSFYHILPSNTSLQYFPNNNASQFSTPVEASYHLSGKWEIVLTNMSYTPCVNTFNNDTITMENNCSKDPSSCPVKYDLLNATKPVKVWLTPMDDIPIDAVSSLTKEIEEKFQDVLQLNFSATKRYLYYWLLKKPDYVLIVSKTVQTLLDLNSDVITYWDVKPQNRNALPPESYQKAKSQEDMYIIFLPLSYNSKSIQVKEANENVDLDTLIERFNAKLPKDLVQMKHQPNNVLMLEKVQTSNQVVILNDKMTSALGFRQGGMFLDNHVKHGPYNTNDSYREQWTVQVVTLKEEDIIAAQFNSKDIVLKPCAFQHQQNAISFLNRKINDIRIEFSCDKKNYVQLKIMESGVKVTLSDILRDIFAFDQNTFTGKGIFSASDVFSLSRRIDYLYIYSSISDYVHIGDTKAPLLAVTPLQVDNTCSKMKDRYFKHPMYVPVITDHISQIDIGIYDGAGQPIPFIHDAVTTLNLHFRQI